MDSSAKHPCPLLISSPGSCRFPIWPPYRKTRRSALVNIRRKALLSSVGFRKRMTSRSPRDIYLPVTNFASIVHSDLSDDLTLCFEVLSCFFDHPSIDSTKKMTLHLFGNNVLKGLVHDNAHARRLPPQNKFVGSTLHSKSPLPVQSFENLSFYSDIRRFGWSSYTSVVVINLWLCRLTGYVLRRRKK